MFTIKYRFYTLSPKQSSENPLLYDQCESLHGPFEVVSQERGENNHILVHCIDKDGQPTTFGPCVPSDLGVLGGSAPRPIVWAMNEHGATIARYDL